MAYSVTLPNGVRFSLLPPSSDFNRNESECDVNCWVPRGQRGNVNALRSSGLKPMNSRDEAREYSKRRYRKLLEEK